MTLVDAGALLETQIIDAEVEVLPNAPRALVTRQRIRVHLGTAELLARIQLFDGAEMAPGNRGFVQIRLESPVVAVPSERFIIRSYAPQITIAGGIVIDNLSVRHRRKDLAPAEQKLCERRVSASDIKETVCVTVNHSEDRGMLITDLQNRTGLSGPTLTKALNGLVEAGRLVRANEVYISADRFRELEERVTNCLEEFHRSDPIAAGTTRDMLLSRTMPYQNAGLAAAVIASLIEKSQVVAENESLRSSSHSSTLSAEDSAFTERLLALYERSGLAVPRIDEALAEVSNGLSRAKVDKLLRLLLVSGKVIKVTDEFYFAGTSIASATDLLRSASTESIDVAAFKDLTGVSRKYAIPLLEYFDREHITARVGDKRVILR
jgi:selenocysteine-specific elongation factor